MSNISFVPPPPDSEAKSLAGMAYNKIYEDILQCQLRPGAKLGMAELQKRYQLGVGPIREALARLSSENLVIAREQKGYRVAPIDQAEIQEGLIARLVVELGALRLSMQSRTPAWEGELLSAFHQLDRASFPDDDAQHAREWRVVHRRFHMALLSNCGSRILVKTAERLFDQSERSRFLRSKSLTPNSLDMIRKEHKRILNAVLDDQYDNASKYLEQHYRRTTNDTLKALRANLDQAG